MKHISTIICSVILLPISAFAQAGDIFEFQDLIIDLLGRLGYLFWIIALTFFFWGLVKFINNASDTDEHEQGKQFMIWGLIAFFVLVSLWGIVNFILVDTLGIDAAPIDYVDKNGSPVF